MTQEKDLMICDCGSTDHMMMVFYSEDEIEGKVYPTIYLHLHLAKRPFWQRVGYGIRYILGRQCRYGAFDEIILNPDDAPKFEKISEYLKKQ
jgi:hypothetical protein